MSIKDTCDVLVVNLFGGPACGKSTIAAQLFASLKARCLACELVTEYAKRKTWERSLHLLKDQLYVSAKQHHEILMAAQDCEVIITDSPAILGIAYASTRDIEAGLPETLRKYANMYTNFNIFLERGPFGYSSLGRSQQMDEALLLDSRIKSILAEYPIMLGQQWDNPTGIAATIQNDRPPAVVAEEIMLLLESYGY